MTDISRRTLVRAAGLAGLGARLVRGADVYEHVSGYSPWLSSIASFVRSGRPASRPPSR